MMIYRPTYRGKDGVLRKAGKFWLKYYVDGKMVRRGLGLTDRRAAEQRAHEIVKREELRAVGVIDPFEAHRKTVLSSHIDDFDMKLKAAGVVERYRKARRGMLQAFVTFSGAKTLNDLNPAAASRWLTGFTERGLGARSVNQRYQSLRQFGRWLAKTHRFGYDPFESLTPLNEAADRRHVRRALSTDEVKRLLEAARTRPLIEAKRDRNLAGVCAEQEVLLTTRGAMRRRIYLTAVKTGLRRGELLRVRWCDVDFAKNRIRIPASSAKSRREETVEVPPDLRLELLSIAPKERKSLAPVFPRKQFPQIRTFLADVKAAGIERKDGDGRVIDFHSLRVSFVTWLVLSGAHPKTVQILGKSPVNRR